MPPRTPDIFDILDVEDREDTYSSLLVHLLRTSRQLRERVLSYAFTTNTPSAEHVHVALRKGLGEHGIVDILLSPSDSSARWRLFIETKVFSGEHGEQTQRYLNACRQIVGPDGRAAGLFLTLDKKVASSAEVKPLSHRDLTTWLKDYLKDLEGHTALHLAASAYVARAQVPLPEATDTRPIRELFFDRMAGLVPHLAGTAALGSAIKRDLPGPWEHAAISIQGHGHANPGLQFWQPEWKGTPIGDRRITRDNIFVHLEIELTEGPPWRLKLHFETVPYFTQAELVTLENYKEFDELRKAFRAVVHAQLGAASGWKKSNYVLQSAAFRFIPPAGETVAGLRQTLLPAFTSITPVVKAALAALRPPPTPATQPLS